jgi:hypothetical protein
LYPDGRYFSPSALATMIQNGASGSRPGMIDGIPSGWCRWASVTLRKRVSAASVISFSTRASGQSLTWWWLTCEPGVRERGHQRLDRAEHVAERRRSVVQVLEDLEHDRRVRAR